MRICAVLGLSCMSSAYLPSCSRSHTDTWDTLSKVSALLCLLLVGKSRRSEFFFYLRMCASTLTAAKKTAATAADAIGSTASPVTAIVPSTAAMKMYPDLWKPMIGTVSESTPKLS